MGTINLPAGSIVKFDGEGARDELVKYSENGCYMLSEDLSLGLSSTFTRLVDGSAPTFFKALAGVTRDLFNVSFSGEYKQLGLEIWDSSEPLTLSFSVDLVMRMDAREDVQLPLAELIQLPLAEDSKNIQGLIPPGPSILSAFGGRSDKKVQGGLVTLTIGGITLSHTIIKSAVPVVARYTARGGNDDKNIPIYAKVQVDAQSAWTATRNMVRDLLGVSK